MYVNKLYLLYINEKHWSFKDVSYPNLSWSQILSLLVKCYLFWNRSPPMNPLYLQPSHVEWKWIRNILKFIVEIRYSGSILSVWFSSRDSREDEQQLWLIVGLAQLWPSGWPVSLQYLRFTVTVDFSVEQILKLWLLHFLLHCKLAQTLIF